MFAKKSAIGKEFEYSYSAPGKFILSGEHSVVYGKDALVATLDLRTRSQSTVTLFNEEQKDWLLDVNLVQLSKQFTLVSFLSSTTLTVDFTRN